MKGKNWREYEPPKRRRRRRRKGGLLRKLCFALVLFLVGYVGFLVYYNFGKPYTVALDAGHGGADVGAEGVIQEVALTEQTVAELQTLLEEDGRFRVVLSRKAGEGATVTERNHKFRRRHPDLMLSVHGNASDSSSANGFECYPSPPGYENYEESLAFAACLTQEMQNIGANLRGTGIAGVRYGYYDENGNKLLCDSSDTTVYSYDTFGMLKNMSCPAVLAEQCFITNPSDVESFGTEEGCQRAAQAYYKAICNYLEHAKSKSPKGAPE